MSRQQKQVYIKNNFSKQCIIMLSDVRKTKCYKDLQGKTQKLVGNRGRKKHSCYICFEKFFSKEELEIHKIVHSSQNKNNTFSDDTDDDDDEEVENSKPALEDTESNINKEICKIVNANMETTQNTEEPTLKVNEEPTLEVTETNENQDSNETDATKDLNETELSDYRCIKCEVNFRNQEDIKSHEHTQHWCKYHCRQCSRLFNTKGGFIVHVLQHNITNISKTSYKCSQCRLGFDDCFELQNHNIAVHNEVPKNTSSGVQLKQNNFTEVKEESIYITDTDTVEQLKKDYDNPITGSIPIFDCDICYDVFASERSLIRHKALHRELEKLPDSFDDSTIVIQDNEPEIIPTKASDKNEVVTSENPCLSKKIAVPMAQLTPLYSGATLPTSSVPVRPNILRTAITQRSFPKIRHKFMPMEDKTDNSNDVNKITQSKNQMIAEKQPIPEQVYPYLSKPEILPNLPSSSPLLMGTPNLPSSSPLLMGTPNLPSSSPLLMGTPISTATMPPLQPISKNQDSSEQNKISLPLGSPQVKSEQSQPQYMYVLCSQGGTLSGAPPQGGQTLRMNIPGPSSPATTFSFNQQVIENNDSIVPSSGPNQVIINQQMNTGGVVINRDAGGLPSTSFMMDQNNTKNEQSSIGCASVEGAPMFYILLPPNQLNQGSATSNQIPKNESKTSSDLKQNQLKKLLPQPNNKLKTNALRVLRKKKSSSTTKTDGYHPSEPLVMPIITSVTGTTIEEEEPVAKEVNTDENQETQLKDTTELVMPIITSIGTVAEESTNTKEKIRTDPVSKYESEFAKFLQETEKESSLKSKKFKCIKHSKLGIASTPTNVSTSNDDVIFVDDNSSSSEPELKKNESNSEETSNVKVIPAVEKSIKETQPKIFVKKLSDLVGIPKSNTDMFMHCCLRCNSQFKDWNCLTKHVRKVHCMHACKFDMCLILSTKTEYDQHINESHRCSFCGLDFRILAAHQRNCSGKKTDVQIQGSSGHVNQSMIVQASGQENYFVITNPESNLTSEDTSCSQ